RVRAAVAARRDRDFVIIARTDARGVTGFDDAVERARRYVKAGADVIFPEALEGEAEFATFARVLPGVPLLANMTEFGRGPLLDRSVLAGGGGRVGGGPGGGVGVGVAGGGGGRAGGRHPGQPPGPAGRRSAAG